MNIEFNIWYSKFHKQYSYSILWDCNSIMNIDYCILYIEYCESATRSFGSIRRAGGYVNGVVMGIWRDRVAIAVERAVA